jgi:hypothetical protein
MTRTVDAILLGACIGLLSAVLLRAAWLVAVLWWIDRLFANGGG